MPKQRVPTRKVSIDLPMDLWERYQELGGSYGMKIKEFVLGAFEAADFLDKFLSETLNEDQLRNISPLLRSNLEKYETLYCGKTRSRNLDQPHKIYFDKRNELHQDSTLAIRTHDIVKEFNKQDQFSLDLLNDKSRKYNKVIEELIIR
ncbi:hypothetical protein NEF87_000961 [Candidatus Lokiarchaeum ossiferum]|uniref:CopG family transcriptional regulator n=1 Tax=Candidatus Lokiarchaeum ossiferum TaxID=2951803 RepID=A0ABY6HMM7_9ARCH|nr:hypothetical protein NEF87_000961 [Candidatus Lokiarchaeum sp. B-35]